jgi:hypothetical protein
MNYTVLYRVVYDMAIKVNVTFLKVLIVIYKNMC